MSARVEIDHEVLGEAVVVVVRGSVAAEGAAVFERRIEALFEEGHRSFVVDLTDAQEVGSPAMRVVLMLHRRLVSGRGALALCGLSGATREGFELAGLNRLLPIQPDRRGALATLPAISRPARIAALARRILDPGGRGGLSPARRDVLAEARTRVVGHLLSPPPPVVAEPEAPRLLDRAFGWMRGHRSTEPGEGR